MNKYGAIKTEVAGIKFDSRAEARRYGELIMLERAGAISGLTRQVSYPLLPSVKFKGSKRAQPALRYIADFTYSDTDTGAIICEDVKGVQTPLFRAKRHMMLALLGIHILVTA